MQETRCCYVSKILKAGVPIIATYVFFFIKEYILLGVFRINVLKVMASVAG